MLCSYYSSCTAIESDATEGFSLMISSSFSILPRFLLLYEIVWILSHHLSPQFCLFGDLSPHLSPHFYLLSDLSHHLFHHFCPLRDLSHHLFHHFCLLGDLSHHLFHHFCLSVHFSGLCYTISMILGLYVILAAKCSITRCSYNPKSSFIP